MPEAEDEKPKKGKTIAEAYKELSDRLDRVEGENDRLREELATARGDVSGDGGGNSSDSLVEDTSKPPTETSVSEASEQDGSEGDEGDDGQETAESNADVSEFPESDSDEPPRPTHLWWRNPWGGR